MMSSAASFVWWQRGNKWHRFHLEYFFKRWIRTSLKFVVSVIKPGDEEDTLRCPSMGGATYRCCHQCWSSSTLHNSNNGGQKNEDGPNSVVKELLKQYERSRWTQPDKLTRWTEKCVCAARWAHRQHPVDASHLSLKPEQVHCEEDEEDNEEPQQYHLKEHEGRPQGPPPSTVDTKEGNEQGHLGETQHAAWASSVLTSYISCFLSVSVTNTDPVMSHPQMDSAVKLPFEFLFLTSDCM